MKKRIVILLVLVFTINSLLADEYFPEASNCEIIEKGKKILNENYEKIYEIPLEENSYFADSYLIDLYNDKIYVLDPTLQGILVFTVEGIFINQYIETGKGPGEFVSPVDLQVADSCIYVLDDQKLSVTTFDLNFNLLQEKILPNIITTGLVPKSISLQKDSLLVSGMVIKNQKPLLWKLDKDMNIVNKFMVIDHKFKGNNMEKMYKYALSSLGRIASDDSMVYIGKSWGTKIIYCINLRKNKLKYKINNSYIPEKDMKINLKDLEKEGELLLYFPVVQIRTTENYIIALEECGGRSKDVIKLPENYYNNLSFYKKDGTYLFSFQDESIPYDFNGYGYDVEETESGFTIYLLSNTKKSLLKYTLVYNHQ